MALSIKDEEADRLARQVAAATGETLTQAIIVALRERLARVKRESKVDGRLARLREITAMTAGLPILDARPEDEILGYDPDTGAFK